MTQKQGTPKRHCMVVFAYYPLGETRVQREAEALVARGFEVDVICLRGQINRTARENVNGVQAYKLSLSRRKTDSLSKLLLDYVYFFILAMFTLIRLHLVRRYHTVQVHNLPDFLVFAAWFPKMMGASIILDLHDLMPEFYISRTGRDRQSFSSRLIVWQERISCYFADHVITVTELWRRTLIERGVPPDKVSVVMNVADDRIFYRPSDIQPKVNTNGQFKLIYHGLQTQRYGLDLLLQAVAHLKHKIPNLRVLLHGGGEYHQTLKNLANELGVSDLVEFSTKFVDVADLPALISTADVGVVPYRRDIFTDGILPTKLMEYTALGIPVIAARTPIIEEYFDETMVEFFTPGNVDELATSILRLYQDQSRRLALVQNANKFNEEYNWAKLSKDYVALLECLEGTKWRWTYQGIQLLVSRLREW